jgi:hypothetical protein
MGSSRICPQPRCSNIRVTPPKSTGTRWIEISSICPDVLLPDLGASHHGDILVPDGGLRPLEGTLDAVGHEGVHTSLGHRLRLGMGDDEHRDPGRIRGAIRSPPCYGEIVGASARDDRPFGVDGLGEEMAVAVVLAEGPLVEALAVVAQGFSSGRTLVVMKPSRDMLLSKITLAIGASLLRAWSSLACKKINLEAVP